MVIKATDVDLRHSDTMKKMEQNRQQVCMQISLNADPSACVAGDIESLICSLIQEFLSIFSSDWQEMKTPH